MTDPIQTDVLELIAREGKADLSRKMAAELRAARRTIAEQARRINELEDAKNKIEAADQAAMRVVRELMRDIEIVADERDAARAKLAAWEREIAQGLEDVDDIPSAAGAEARAVTEVVRATLLTLRERVEQGGGT